MSLSWFRAVKSLTEQYLAPVQGQFIAGSQTTLSTRDKHVGPHASCCIHVVLLHTLHTTNRGYMVNIVVTNNTKKLNMAEAAAAAELAASKRQTQLSLRGQGIG